MQVIFDLVVTASQMFKGFLLFCLSLSQLFES